MEKSQPTVDLSTDTAPIQKPPTQPPTQPPSTPDFIKRMRTKINKHLWNERNNLDDEKKEALKKAHFRLNQRDKELCTAILDTQAEFRDLLEATDYCAEYIC